MSTTTPSSTTPTSAEKSDVEMHSKSATTAEIIITNLKIISNLKPNDKLTVRDEILDIDKPRYYQGVNRWWNDDSRTTTLAELEKIINKAFGIIDEIYKNEVHSTSQTYGSSTDEENYYERPAVPSSSVYFKNENSHQLQTFSLELKNSIKGLQNLQMTYKSDITVCSKIDVIIEKINIRIKKIDSLLTIKQS